MSKPKFSGYPSSKPQYYRELWTNGPIMVEARRLARIDLYKAFAKEKVKPELCSEVAINKAITVMVFNSEDAYLKRAKWNLGDKR